MVSRSDPAVFIRKIYSAYPNTQAVYLYGSWGTKDQRHDSDLDLAVLLPPAEARTVDQSIWSSLRLAIARLAETEHADLINARQTSVMLRKEIVAANRRIHCSDENAADEFEMLTLSFYQKLNDERREIVASGLSDGRFYDV